MMAPTLMLIIHEFQKIKKRFLWGNPNPKIKRSTLSNDYKNCSWKSVDIFFKSDKPTMFMDPEAFKQKLSWMENITTLSCKKAFGNHFKFNSNLQVHPNRLKDFPHFYRKILNFWSTNVLLLTYILVFHHDTFGTIVTYIVINSEYSFQIGTTYSLNLKKL